MLGATRRLGTLLTGTPHPQPRRPVSNAYYAGILSEPTSLYHTGKEQWSPPRRPEAQRRWKELREVFTHPITKVWNHALGWRVLEVLDAHAVS